MSGRSKPRGVPPANATEIDIAEAVIAQHGDDVRHCVALGGWLAWRDGAWRPDATERVREHVKRVARALATSAGARFDRTTFQFARHVASAKGIASVLAVMRSDPRIAIEREDADRDPWLLNVANGTVDLRTGQRRAHDRRDLITRRIATPFDPAAPAPEFERFLAETQPDAEVRAYLARFFGYAVIGVVREHVLGAFCGAGANGKSVLVDVVSGALGEYARPGPSTLIVSTGKNMPHPTDVASCYGARLVVVHETARGAAIDAAKVKLLTGGDILTARRMREDFWTFRPTHTLLLLTNHVPSADAGDAALWRRIQLVRFPNVVPVERRDLDLASRIIRNELAGVLAWIVRGALDWQRIGLAPPAAVRDGTEAYRSEHDTVGAFLTERCVPVQSAEVRAQVLYDAYRQFCADRSAAPVSPNEFGPQVVARGHAKRRTALGNTYQGLGLLADDTDAPADEDWDD